VHEPSISQTVLGRSIPRWRAVLLGVILLATLIAAIGHDRIEQQQTYHAFADDRSLLGVPNVFDVASNLPFLIVGTLGVALCLGHRRPPAAAGWTTVFTGTALVSFGSAYYHWAPSDATLVWDRLPMTLAFMALFVALVAEHVGEDLERFMLAPALAIGVLSVFWWHWTGDLRFYLWVQFVPLLCIPIVLMLFPPRFTHRRYLVYGLGLYVLAKLAEIADRDIFSLSAHMFSGHTLKHLLAAAAVFTVLVMLWRRSPLLAR
jgi:hypothetical protein